MPTLGPWLQLVHALASDIGTLTLQTFASLLPCALLFGALERIWPLVPAQPTWRRGSAADLTYWVMAPLVQLFSRVLGTACMIALVLLAGGAVAPDLRHGFGPVMRQPYALIVVEMLFLTDFIAYFSHRLCHRVPLLWRFHAVHHSSRELDWLSAVRFHPVNDAITHVFNAVPLFCLGFPADALLPLLPLISLYALFIHSNIDLRLRPLAFVLNSPIYHRFHHTGLAEGGDKNFAGLFPITDYVFGTYHLPDSAPLAIGLDRDDVPDDVVGQLTYPFRAAAGAGAEVARAGQATLVAIGAGNELETEMKSMNIAITGGSRGVGFGLARAFLRRGFRVTIASRNASSLQHALDDPSLAEHRPRLQGMVCDVAQADQVRALWELSRSQGPVDVWINNAGMNVAPRRLWDVDPVALVRLLSTNVLGVTLGCHTALRGMCEQGHGRIYNIEGFGADGAKLAGFAGYGASKAAVRYLSDSLAKEVRGTSVVVATADPGLVVTDMFEEVLAAPNSRWLAPLSRALAQPIDIAAEVLARQMLDNRRSGVHLRAVGPLRAFGLLLGALFRARASLPRKA